MYGKFIGKSGEIQNLEIMFWGEWEYQIVHAGTTGFTEKKPDPKLWGIMDRLGDEGWELVSFSPVSIGYGGTTSFICVFKREVVEN